MDNIQTASSTRILSLERELIQPALDIQSECARQKIPLYVAWGRRTWEEQELMFRYGRTIPGDVITDHRPGYSAHNYGLALDFCLLRNRELITWKEACTIDYQRAMWIRVIKMFEEKGWESGIRWPKYEPGHVQNLLGQSIRELYDKHESTSGYNRNQHVREQINDQEIHF